MLLKHLCHIVLLFSVCVSSTVQDVRIKSETPNIFDKVLDQADCDCGTYQRSCSFYEGKKKCNCIDGYADQFGVCRLCSCKGYTSMYGCHFDGWDMKCNCLKGYAQQHDECKECDCGDHGNCTLEGWYFKTCSCEEGYIESGGMCVECDCGENASCRIRDGKKICNCWYGYQKYKGTCTACSCDSNANCQFDKYGYKECNCHSGYSMKNGLCTACNCDPGTSCIFDSKYKGSKECICPTGYLDDYGYGCKEIEKCHISNKCPRSTKCIDMDVGYRCECGDGYEEPKYKGANYNIMVDGCDDIDECVTEWKPCNDPNTRCVNTPGSYRCDCTEGFSSSNYAYRPKENRCVQTYRPWRSASIVVGCLSAVTIFGMLIGIYYKSAS